MARIPDGNARINQQNQQNANRKYKLQIAALKHENEKLRAELELSRSLPELPAAETEERGCGTCRFLYSALAPCDECRHESHWEPRIGPAEPETCECAEPEPREAYRWNMSVAYHECRKCGKRIKPGRE